MDREKENALRMLEGCVCRLSVTDEKDEAYRMFNGIMIWAQQVLNHTLHRIEEQNKSNEEGGELHVRRTKRKRHD